MRCEMWLKHGRLLLACKLGIACHEAGARPIGEQLVRLVVGPNYSRRQIAEFFDILEGRIVGPLSRRKR